MEDRSLVLKDWGKTLSLPREEMSLFAVFDGHRWVGRKDASDRLLIHGLGTSNLWLV